MKGTPKHRLCNVMGKINLHINAYARILRVHYTRTNLTRYKQGIGPLDVSIHKYRTLQRFTSNMRGFIRCKFEVVTLIVFNVMVRQKMLIIPTLTSTQWCCSRARGN